MRRSTASPRTARISSGSAPTPASRIGTDNASLAPPSPGRAVRALFEDRDSDLWIGTASGLERWRDGAFTAYPEVRTVASGDVGPIFVDDTDRVWFAPSSGGLYWM